MQDSRKGKLIKSEYNLGYRDLAFFSGMFSELYLAICFFKRIFEAARFFQSTAAQGGREWLKERAIIKKSASAVTDSMAPVKRTEASGCKLIYMW